MRRLFLNAFGKEKLDRPPVWIMRQAGRYLPEYREVRSKFVDFMDMCRNPEACCEVALQPLRRYDLDAAIVFSDILTIPEAMGLDLEFIKGEGPIFPNPIVTNGDLNKLLDTDESASKLQYVYNAVRTTKSAINVPLIGFTGSPWTLAAYMIEGKGSKQFNKLRKMMYANPQLMHQLLQKLADVIVIYLLEQIKSGADSLMIFDTWGGILPLAQYKNFSLDYMQYIAKNVKQAAPSIPIVFFTKGGSNFFGEYENLSCDGIGIDWSVTIEQARHRIGNGKVLQGNFDPAFLYADKESIRKIVKQHMNFIQSDRVNNYIVNLGHGIYPDIDPDHVKEMIDAIRSVNC
ncbi:uroporphyrinogen decarboxylase [Allofrancisella guangzhouensis]|uniref:Uroporphyrinogen decarboxylase n=1 Tax=Allofrancisella guangzhouensis TaxID=594679 RepID=A0A0A8E2W2_9GAMM|nr:uroporphyrinogen decarboxylase [Allofrancisella guangzhouensis]AJC48299.1 uroporphyrinogen decarboxylase [Allofrancisella guangzhouensis]MBK2026615.1 uroporphyrinogen decarboxylase [Allofrancisella guangzhouensis]MBK2043810.1 uroporphyrinogen decarboxylase [Allofrancisella guangzhouensis]MBK2045602.1 uroporphyrinogen decarboxylase [Allofrancisella guangzhouensis]